MKKMTVHDIKNILDKNRPFVLTEKDGWVRVCEGRMHELQGLDDIHALSKRTHSDIAFTLPYRTIRERGFEAKGDEPILAINIERMQKIRTEEMIKSLPKEDIKLADGPTPSLSDEEYAKLVAGFQENEIEAGNASQTTLSRRFEGKIADFSLETALSIFRILCERKGHYMAVLFADIVPDNPARSRFIVGATPERHLTITGNETIMIPIAGTLRKEDQKTFAKRLDAFINDPKEINELFQVVDEEMKIMGRICPEGGAIKGPYLREIGAVVHSEYELAGQRGTNTIESLRRTLHAPTVVGSPMESAARIIARYEPVSRRYYGGEIGFYFEPRGDEPDGDLDSAILLRCAEIFNDGGFIVQAGGGLVRDSDPANEARESTAKAMGLIDVLTGAQLGAQTYLTDKLYKKVHKTLESRNATLSPFWLNRQDPDDEQRLALKDLNVSIINNEDDFAYMIGHVIKSLGAEANVLDTFDFSHKKDGADITIIGPGPGDPNDMTHPRMERLQHIIRSLRANNHPLLGICLGHQAIAIHEGLTVQRQTQSTQGMQIAVRTFNTDSRLGFYNSFSPIFTDKARRKTDIRMDLDDENRIIAMQGNGFIGFQFHPESIMSHNGSDLLYKALVTLRYAL